MIQSDDLSSAGIRHGFFTRNGGVSSGIYGSLNIGLGSDDDPEKVLENRKRVASRLDVEADRLVTPHQIHSPNVIAVEGPWAADTDRKADALVTNQHGVAIGIATADCGPVLFADTEAGVIGAAHSGWKGAVGGILENTLAAMEQLGATRSNVTAVLGPTISQKAYEVGPEFRDRFIAEKATSARYFIPSEQPDHHMFDLPGFIVDRLSDAGVGAVQDLGLCTYADEDKFYSYRRTTHRGEPDYGRLISAIVLTGN
ncbi:peptidoglycan editing factor PgeF [Roseibium polysiphoniae]|uniref:Purine nucleoside phosphorylase n=1 Tax=Roseibium polysiphoniae TaxID=2571221 RepID=A0A944GSP5_9HYPH|nr:peptidoglycan editing factor PgeF [Roseibium polysiphoniae]